MGKIIYKKKAFRPLYELAKEIKKSHPNQSKTIAYDDIHKIIEDNDLYQIELELQNEELQKTILSLEEERIRYTDLYDFIPFGCITLDHQGTIIEANAASANLLGIKKGHLLNKPLSRYVETNFQHVYTEHIQQITQSALQTCELKLMRKNGPIFYAQLDTKAIINSITKQTYLILFIKDISERKQKESYLHDHQKKLAAIERDNSMGEFAEIISHELNHPLAVITNYLHGCIRRLESGKFQTHEIVGALKKASDQSHRIIEIILRMKNFICKGNLNYEIVNINELINETISLINIENLSYPITVRFYPLKNPPALVLDKINIQQVIINLARNAVEAMKDTNISDPRLMIEANYLNTKQIEISIIDNGPGISPDNIHQLFNPYYTTKLYGIGLGLTVCRKIIESHGGTISAINHPFGTCFRFTLLTQETNQENLPPPYFSGNILIKKDSNSHLAEIVNE